MAHYGKKKVRRRDKNKPFSPAPTLLPIPTNPQFPLAGFQRKQGK